MKVEQMLHRSLPVQGYVTAKSAGFKFNGAELRGFQGLCYFPKEGVVTHSAVWKEKDERNRDTWTNHVLQVDAKDYRRLFNYPAALIKLHDPGHRGNHSINLDSSIIPPPAFTNADATFLINTFTRPELQQILSSLLLHSESRNDHGVRIGISASDPEDLILALLRWLPSPARLMSYTTLESDDPSPGEDFGLVVYHHWRKTVRAVQSENGHLQVLVDDLMESLDDPNGRQKVEAVYEHIYDDIAGDLKPDTAYRWTALEYGLDSVEKAKALAKAYIDGNYLAGAQKVLERWTRL